jgi:biotin/methionine sulfoxide reductase
MPKVLRSASHWGAFRMNVRDKRLVGVSPFEHDPSPTPLIDAWTEMLTSPLRVDRPAVRKGWLQGDKGSARGEDEYVNVGWDEALSLTSGELERVRQEYGNSAIFGGSYGWSSAGRLHHARTLTHRFLNLVGGFTGQTTNYSFGAAMAFLPRIAGTREAIGSNLTSWASICRETDILLAFGGIAKKNWEVLSGGFGVHRYPDAMQQLADSKAKVTNVSPNRGDVADGIADWVAIRPNSDAALVIALSHWVLVNGHCDQRALTSMTVGFDRYAAYLRGDVDGVKKDAAWAEALTGISTERIEALARSLPGRRVMLTAAWSLQRARHGEQIYWAIIALAAMLGQIGLPGGGFAFGYGSINGLGNPPYRTPISGLSVGSNPVGISIPVARVADMLLGPGGSCRFDGRTITYPDIKLIYWAGGNPFHHHQDLNRLRQAFRRPDTVIVHEPFWTSTARHADIVLPATTPLERNDIAGSSRDAFILAMHQGVAPVGYARNDFDIFAELGERLGIGDAYSEGLSENDWLRHMWKNFRDNITGRGIVAPEFEEFWETGYFRMPEPESDYVMYERFRADPVSQPLDTPSGRFEIFSQAIAAMGDPEQPGHPVWNDPEEWLGGKRTGEYPLHLLTPQPATHLHSQLETSSHSQAGRIEGRAVVSINPIDAEARGIAERDRVRLFNDRGACIAHARITSDMRQGVVSMPTGMAFDPNDSYLDRASNPNVLTRDIGTSRLGQGCSAQSCLIEIARDDGAAPALRMYDPPEIKTNA